LWGRRCRPTIGFRPAMNMMRLLPLLLFAAAFPAVGQTTLDINPGPNKRFLNFDAASTGDGTNFGFANTLTRNTDGTYNDVMRWGWNVGDGSALSARLDTSDEAFFYAIEHQWLTNGRYWSEAHQYQITADGRSFRPDSSIYPHDGGSGAERSFNVDKVNIGTWAVVPVTRFVFDTALNRIHTVSGLLAGIGGTAQTGRTLKVYGNAEVTGPFIVGQYVTASYAVLSGDLFANSVKVGNKKVVGSQCPAIPNAVDAADMLAKFNSLLVCLRSHGLIAP
jgi:hypothetical protein